MGWGCRRVFVRVYRHGKEEGEKAVVTPLGGGGGSSHLSETTLDRIGALEQCALKSDSRVLHGGILQVVRVVSFHREVMEVEPAPDTALEVMTGRRRPSMRHLLRFWALLCFMFMSVCACVGLCVRVSLCVYVCLYFNLCGCVFHVCMCVGICTA